MKRVLTVGAVATAGLVLGGMAFAAEGWKLSLGISYRSLGEIEYDGMAFSNRATGGQYVTGTYAPAGGFLSVLNYTDNGAPSTLQVNAAGTTATLHSVTFRKDTEDADAGWGRELGASKALWQSDALTMDLDLSLVGVWSETTSEYKLNGTSQVFNYTLGFPANPTWLANQVGDASSNLGFAPAAPGAANPNGNVIGRLRYDCDVDVYTLGCGAGAEYNLSWFSVKLGLGPSVSLVDYDISAEQRVAYVNGPQVYRSTATDDGTEFKAGAYAGVSVRVPLTEAFSVELGGRYDWIPSEMDTDYAEIELTGFSGELKLVFSF